MKDSQAHASYTTDSVDGMKEKSLNRKQAKQVEEWMIHSEFRKGSKMFCFTVFAIDWGLRKRT